VRPVRIADVEASGLWPGRVVTEVVAGGPFWDAEGRPGVEASTPPFSERLGHAHSPLTRSSTEPVVSVFDSSRGMA
jgi:hypothetical protein